MATKPQGGSERKYVRGRPLKRMAMRAVKDEIAGKLSRRRTTAEEKALFAADVLAIREHVACFELEAFDQGAERAEVPRPAQPDLHDAQLLADAQPSGGESRAAIAVGPHLRGPRWWYGEAGPSNRDRALISLLTGNFPELPAGEQFSIEDVIQLEIKAIHQAGKRLRKRRALEVKRQDD